MRKIYQALLLLTTGLFITGRSYAQPSITYTPVTPSCTGSNIVVSGVTIADGAGVPTAGALMPRLYARRNTGSWFSVPGTLASGSATSGTWNFSIAASTFGGLSAGNTVSYFVVAQNNSSAIDANPSAGFSATDVNTITTFPSAPNTYTVNSVPGLTGLFSTPTTTCLGFSFTLSAGTVSGSGTLTSYTWSGPDGYMTTGTSPSAVVTPTTTAATGTYSLFVTYPGAGCTSTVRTRAVTVNGTMPAVTGTATVCEGATTTFSIATSGGIWSSSNPGVASINSSNGITNGITQGTATISYSVGACSSTIVVTVNPIPLPLTGGTGTCIGSTTTISSTSTGGAWASSNTAVATIASGTGVMTGVTSGTTTISYTLGTGCRRTILATVYPFPSVIGGTLTTCVGSGTSLTSSPSGGTWSSSSTGIATVSTSGVVTGISNGTSNITYTLPTGCFQTAVVTVNPVPAAISGPGTVCAFSTITLASATAGGTWSSSTPSAASIDATTGVVTGNALGIANISYTLGTGCRAITAVTAYATPAAIVGTSALCMGSTATMGNTTTGGTWSSSNTATATIASGTGFVTTVATGTTNITYTVPTGCYRTLTLSVNTSPAAIAGATNICATFSTTLTNSVATGSWTSSNSSIANIGSGTGVVTGNSAGTVTIAYRLPNTCQVTTTLTVNALPAVIAGSGTVCPGLTTSLTNATASGVWSSSSPANGTVDAIGVVTGIAAGTTDIAYTIPSGCFRIKTVTVNPLPAAIVGSISICPGITSTLTNASAGGTWSSSTTASATINNTSGLMTGISTGTSTITYRLPTSCMATAVATVNPLPSAIVGSPNACLGVTSTLSNPDAGGTWASSNTAVATISAGGALTGVALGTSTITYTLGTGCIRTLQITVNSVPTAITGTIVVCENSTTDLLSTPGSGVWSSSNTLVATAGSSSGVITGVTAGTTTISYTIGNGCSSTATLTVNSLPAPTTGSSVLCIGATSTLSNLTAGGAWTTANPAIATVSAGGVVTGINYGNTVISYTIPSGCAWLTTVNVNALPGVITGSANVCVGSNVALSSFPYTGTWSSSDVTVATISSGGVVTGVTIGTAIITNTFTSGCFRTLTMTVNPTPSPITGVATVCGGYTTALANADAGGVWSSSDPSILTVDAITGLVTGVSGGVNTVTYSFGSGCRATISVTVNNTPPLISGFGNVCVGDVMTLTDIAGGTWMSGNIAVATISTGPGLVTGISSGTATITFTAPNGCTTSRLITVNPLPAAITGSLSICAGYISPLANATPGGTWSTPFAGIASVNIGTGVVTGISAGTSVITYRLPTGCSAYTTVTINAIPAPIIGNAAVCIGLSSLLTTTTTGGGWSSSDPTIATIDGTGLMTALATGNTTISYITAEGCYTTRTATVNPLPVPIAGVLNVCQGSSSTLTDAASGGTWVSSNVAVATIGFTGTVTGISPGVSNITYTLPTTCLITTQVTVDPVPAPITGLGILCQGTTSTLSNATGGGTWLSGTISVATIDAAGLVTAINPGTSNISYTLASGCKATMVVTVQTVPTVISGTTAICTGQSTTLTSIPNGGAWSSSAPLVATASAGIVTGLTPGTATVSYTLGSGCTRTTVVSVSQTPPVSTGVTSFCVGSTSLLSNGDAGGTWTSSNSLIATVDPSTGLVTGLVASSAVITYTMPSGCRTTTNILINNLPAAISGTASVCTGLTTTLTNTTGGGSWVSSTPSIATIGSLSGIVLGVAPGTTTISYMLIGTGCVRSRIVSVNPNPAPIATTGFVCTGSTTTLTNPTLGGTWNSANTSIASIIPGTGVATGVSLGVVDITYRMSTGCFVKTPLTVNLLPAALVGTSSVCMGSNTVYTSSTPGGAWSSSNTAVATVGTDGVISGVSVGGANITYMMPTGCFVTKSVSVLALPMGITGTLEFCEGATSYLSNLSPGGGWSSSNTFVAVVGASSGIVTGLFAGTSNITYTLSSGCTATAQVTVDPTPAGITGVTNVCLGSSSTLTSLTTGGSWSSGNPVVATIGASTGVMNALSLGTARITYILSTGCRTTTVATVSPIPANIMGVPSVCVGSSTTLTDATGGGIWSSSNNSIATVNTSGVVSGILPGVVTIAYTLSTGCAKSVIFTVNAVPGSIVETAELCNGTTMTLTSPSTGGVWTSGTLTVASIDVLTGLLSAVGPGTSIITYSLSTGCKTYTIATVNPLPGPISGVTNLCAGSVVTFTNAAGGGTWTSSNSFTAAVNASTGEVTGTGLGVANISYTMPGGCFTTLAVTVTPAPPAIEGDVNLCNGETSLLTNPVAGGSWSSSNPTVATIDLGSGLLTSVSPGTSIVTYILGAGCRVIVPILVNPAPSVITGPSEVCMGHTVTLYNSVAGGTWTSSDGSVASVDAITGIVSGVANNTVVIKYELPGGCFALFNMTVNATPPPIGGADSVCQGLTTELTNGSPFSGIWTSSDPSIAPVGLFSGIVTGVAQGTATVVYTILGTGCYRGTIVTVNPTPDPITGVTSVCEGAFTLLSSTSVGGTWSSSNMSVAVVGSGTGIVTGLVAGGTDITYTLPTTCIATTFVVVNPSPAAIAGTAEICVGSSSFMTNATPFGTWSCSNPSRATINSTTGELVGISNGTATISYILLSTGCYTTQQITVNPIPPVIVGNPNICIGSSTFLTNPASGGTWSSSNPAVAAIDVFGNVTSVSTGTTTITYTVTSACYITKLITVEPTLNPITGPSSVCEFSTITLGNTYLGGIWTSGTPANATIDAATGVVTGVSAGTVSITYETPLAGCSAMKTVTVDPVPSPITGVAMACVGLSSPLADLTTGGTWSSTDVTIATIDASGVVTAVAANTVVISYTVGTGCAATVIFTANPLPDAGTLSGPTEVCLNSSITLSSTNSDGIWSSSDILIANVTDTVAGIIRGDGVGTAIITYTHTNMCGSDTATYNVLVKPLPDAGTITGTAGLCIDYTSALTSTVTGGVWTSRDPFVASINGSGVVTALSAGTTVISYAVTTSCGTDYDTFVVTVFTMPDHNVISVHPDAVLCLNTMNVNFGAANLPPAGLTYVWTAENAVVFATSADKQNAIVNFPTPGVAVIHLRTQTTSTGCFVMDSFTVTVNTDSAVTPEVKYYGGELICTDNTSTSYQWGYDDAITLDSTMLAGEIMQSFYLPVPDFAGKRYWVIAQSGGCYQKVYYNAPSLVGPTDLGMVEVKLFPNPADSRVNIEVHGLNNSDETTIRVMDMLGKTVDVSVLVNGKGSINVSGLASGVYSVMLINNGTKIASRTFVKN